MWAPGDNNDDGDDWSENGKPVRLYQPIPYGRKQQPSDDSSSTTSSFVGGRASAAAPPRCGTCHDSLYLLVQLHVPDTQRTMQVFGCNRLACLQGLFVGPTLSNCDGNKNCRDNMLCYESGGVVVCRRLTATDKTNDEQKENPSDSHVAPTSDWLKGDAPAADGTAEKSNDGSSANDNEWDLAADDDDNNTGLDDLESKLAAMETTAAKPKTSAVAAKPAPQAAAPKQLEPSNAVPPNCFPWFVLHSLQEPPVVRRSNTDQDDVGIGDYRKDAAKIKQMLAKYMAEEEDEDVLAMLRGTTGSAGGGGGKGAERDERLSATDRALLNFSDRLKRSPRQVLRYARGGRPLWSIPTISLEKQADKGREKNQRNRMTGKHSQRNSSSSKLLGLEKLVPPCSACGAPRVFEFQLVPPLLHVLQVDKHAKTDNRKSNTGSLASTYQQGGMDWGNIAVYTCSNPSCCPETPVEEFCVVQDSVDERPTGPKRHMPQGAAIIQEDTKFEDGDEEEEEDEDGNDDDEAWEEDDFDDNESWQ